MYIFEIDAKELMRELHEECDRKERARSDCKERTRAGSGGLAGSGRIEMRVLKMSR